MKTKREQNINTYNIDISQNASYLYTKDDSYSSRIATKKQTDKINSLINKYFRKGIKIIDIGCGDGTYTIELFKGVLPSQILGIDPAQNAINIANKKIKNKYNGRISFKVGNIYNIDKLFRKGQFDLAVVRGVLHHLYRPGIAIKYISNVFPSVIVLEPNGYNLVLKIIEKTSSYHRRHEEKSYWPPLLNKWFQKRGYRISEQEFFSLVPYFCPNHLAKFLKYIEVFERIIFFNRLYCGSNLVLYQKNIHRFSKLKSIV